MADSIYEGFVVAFATALVLHAAAISFNAKGESLLLRLSLISYLIFWSIIPGLSAVMLNIATEIYISDSFIHLYLLESVAIYGMVVYFFKFQKARLETPALEIDSRAFLILASVFVIDLILMRKVSYLDANDLDLATATPDAGIVLFVTSLIGSYLTYCALITKDKVILYSSVIIIAYSVSVTLGMGGRMGLTWLLFVYAYRALKNAGRLKAINVLIITSIAAGALLLASATSQTRGDAYGVTIDKQIGVSGADLLLNLYQKLNSYETGMQLIEGYGPGSAGMRPYYGSVLFFIPRSIYPDKPIPGSITDDNFGLPSRLVPRLNNPNDSINNVGVSHLAVSIWHWGWILGPIAFVLSGLISLWLLRIVFTSESVGLRVVGINLVPIPGFLYVFPSPDILIKHSVTVGCVYLLIKIVTLYQKQ